MVFCKKEKVTQRDGLHITVPYKQNPDRTVGVLLCNKSVKRAGFPTFLLLKSRER